MEPGVLEECGLVAIGDSQLAKEHAKVSPPRIDALETTRRVTPGGDVRFDTMAVVTQVVTVARQGKTPGFSFVGGSTLLFAPQGSLRLAILKSVAGEHRIKRRRDFHHRRFAGGRALLAEDRRHHAVATAVEPPDAPVRVDFRGAACGLRR